LEEGGFLVSGTGNEQAGRYAAFRKTNDGLKFHKWLSPPGGDKMIAKEVLQNNTYIQCDGGRGKLVTPKDTSLKKRMVRPEAVDSAVRDAISGGRAIAVQDIRNGENNSGVIVERLMPVKGAADVKRLTGLLSYASDAERTKAQESLSLYLKDRANYDSVREKLAVLLDVALSSGQAELRGRRLVLLLTNGEDVFSMGFALVHA